MDTGGSAEAAAAPEPQASVPEDLLPEIEYANEANKQFQMNGKPHRIAVSWRRGGPVFHLVGHVPHREVVKAEVEDLLSRT